MEIMEIMALRIRMGILMLTLPPIGATHIGARASGFTGVAGGAVGVAGGAAGGAGGAGARADRSLTVAAQ